MNLVDLNPVKFLVVNDIKQSFRSTLFVVLEGRICFVICFLVMLYPKKLDFLLLIQSQGQFLRSIVLRFAFITYY
jgi:hypothetical protein